jgi:hypothetical protein
MIRRTIAVLVALTVASSAVAAQELAINTDVLDRFVTAHDKEREEIAALDPQLREIDRKIRRFRECKLAFEAAGSATRSRLGGLAARAGIRARCGANNEGEIEREKETLRTQATTRAAQAGNFTVPVFSRLRIRLERIYAYGDRAGLAAPELEAVNARRERFASIFGGGTAVADAIRTRDAWPVDCGHLLGLRRFAVRNDVQHRRKRVRSAVPAGPVDALGDAQR